MSPMVIVRTRAELREKVSAWRSAGLRIGLAPTMGALHEGHLSLVRLLETCCDKVIASVFVNPTQFGPNEDFQAYPRDEARDSKLLADTGCHLLYAPPMEEIYPQGFATRVSVASLTDGMEGAARPGHFEGVATVVTKLLMQAAPDVAAFGEKDYQQLQVVRRLVADLDLPMEILAAPIVRDHDGLALSSRNAYLTPEQRRIAPTLHRALMAASRSIAAGGRIDVAEREAVRTLIQAGFDSVDYVEVRSASDLSRLGPGPIDARGRILAAARLGRPRLLDNVPV